MPEDKSIKIRAILDQGEFDQQVGELTRKLQNMQRKSEVFRTSQETAGQGKMGEYSRAFFGDYNRESITNLREAFNLNSRKMRHESGELQNKQRELVKMEKMERQITQDSKDRVKLLKDEIRLIKERGQELVRQNNMLRSTAQQLGSNLQGFKGEDRRIEVGAAGPVDPRTGSRIMGALGGWAGMAGTAGTGMGAVMRTGAAIGMHRIQRDRTFMSELSSQQRVANMSIMNQMREQGSRNLYEGVERKEALNMALKEMRGRKAVDAIGALGSAVMKIGGGAAAGGFLGGKLGAAGGPIGAAGGAVVGGVIGGLNTLSDRRTWNMLFDRSAYLNTLRAEGMQNFERNLTAMRIMQPRKFMGQDMWQRDWRNLQKTERQLGMPLSGILGGGTRDFESEAEELGIGTSTGDRPIRQSGTMPISKGRGRSFYSETEEGYQKRLNQWKENNRKRDELKQEIDMNNAQRTQEGWFGRNMQNIFSRERIQQAAGELLQGGAKGEYVRGAGAGFVAQLQRLGITNAGRAVGRMAGVGQDAQQTDTAVKRLLAEAMTTGMDDSKLFEETGRFGEDMRRLVDITSQLYTRSGGSMEAVRQFNVGVMGGGSRELQAAQAAFQMRNQLAGQAGGRIGAYKWSFLQSEQGKEFFGNIGNPIQLTMANLENLKEDSALVQQWANEQGVSPREMIRRIRVMQRESITMGPEVGPSRERLRSGFDIWKRATGKSNATLEDYVKTPEGREYFTDYSNLIAEQIQGFGGQPEKEKISFAAGQIGMGQESAISAPLQIGGGALGTGAFGALGLPEEFLTGEDKKKRQLWRTQIFRESETDAQEASKSRDQRANITILNTNLDKLAVAAQVNAELTPQQINAMIEMTGALSDLLNYMKNNRGADTGNLMELMSAQVAKSDKILSQVNQVTGKVPKRSSGATGGY